MIGFLIKNGSTVVDKQVVSGDATDIVSKMEVFKKTHPELTVETYNSDSPDFKASFDDVVLADKPNPKKTDWQTAKASGPVQAVAYIAKYLGLE